MSTVITSEAIACFPYLFEPQPNNYGGDPKYCVTLVFKKDAPGAKETMTKLNAIAKAALEKKFPDEATRPRVAICGSDKSPIKDGDTWAGDDGIPKKEKYHEYENAWIIRVSSKRRPQVVDNNLNEIMDREEIYPGVLLRASVNAFGYSNSGNKGVSFGLENVQKMGDGPRLGGGGAPAVSQFSVVEGGAGAAVEDDPFA